MKETDTLCSTSNQSKCDVDHLPHFLRDPETRKHVLLYIRDKVLKEIATISEDVYLKDVESFKKSNEMIARFLFDYSGAHAKKSMEETCDQVSRNIIEALKWRKSIGLNDMQDTDFPTIFSEVHYKYNYCYIGHDGRLYTYSGSKRAEKLGEWIPLFEKFAYYEMNRVINHFAELSDEGVVDFNPISILDVSQARPSDVTKIDISLALSLKEKLSNHFPGLTTEVWIIGLPWFLKSLFCFVMRLLPLHHQRKVKIMDLDSAVKAVGIENLPKEIGGRYEGEKLVWNHETNVSMEEIGKKNGISDKEVLRIKLYLEELSTAVTQ